MGGQVRKEANWVIELVEKEMDTLTFEPDHLIGKTELSGLRTRRWLMALVNAHMNLLSSRIQVQHLQKMMKEERREEREIHWRHQQGSNMKVIFDSTGFGVERLSKFLSQQCRRSWRTSSPAGFR